jgi:uncharacterized membrane protein
MGRSSRIHQSMRMRMIIVAMLLTTGITLFIINAFFITPSQGAPAVQYFIGVTAIACALMLAFVTIFRYFGLM